MNIDLTHPEVLTIEQLQKHLIKFIGSDITNDKYELIQLFYKYIAPLPQRKFRTNRLGTILTDVQRQRRGEKGPLTFESETPNEICKLKSSGEKHESDRGIYTITMQKSGNRNTAPIKLKRPSVNNDDETNKRAKLDETNS